MSESLIGSELDYANSSVGQGSTGHSGGSPPDPPTPALLNPSGVPIQPALRIQQQATDPSITATTTFQEDLTFAGQRQVNLIWESTQGKIALYVIVGTMAIDGIAILVSIATAHEMSAATALALGFVNSLATGVVSFYFSRTNHTQIGGIGNKPNEPYVGR